MKSEKTMEEVQEVITDIPIVPTVDKTKILAAVDAWWMDRVHGSILTRNTLALNYLGSIVDDLKARISAL
jgi:hypothetical protein